MTIGTETSTAVASSEQTTLHPSLTPAKKDPGRGHAGDLARRVAGRRVELGLSLEEVSKQAGIDPAYLKYFEQSADARLSGGTLFLLARALQTTPRALEGGGGDQSSGLGRPGSHPVLESLTWTQCEAHLGAGGVGRVVFLMDRGPVALPVNFEFAEGEVIVSTDVAKASALEAQAVVGFEVDRVDDAMSEGWSVLVSGCARRIDDPDEVLRLSSLDLEAWAGGARHALIGIRPDDITGRVIIHNAIQDQD
jgi:hypothetical protein